MSIRHDFGAVVDLEEKALQETDEAWTFTGYASIFNSKDLGNDAVMPGAFAKSLRDHGLPLILFQHKMDEAPVGTCIDAKEDKRGLWIKGELPKDDTFVSGRLVPQLKRRGLRGMSIGYKATETEKRKSDGVRLLKTIRLYEASFVSLPMHPEAGLESIKGVVPFCDLPIELRDRPFDAESALRRIRAKFVGGDGKPTEDARQAFLYVDETKADDWDAYLLPIADVDESGGLVASRHAIYRAVASMTGARKGGLENLSEDAEAAIKANLDRYYGRLNLKQPFSSLSIPEWKALDADARQARLRGLGVTGDLARALASTQLKVSATADRSPVPLEAGPTVDAKTLHTAMADFSAIAAAVTQLAKDLKTP